MNTIEGTILGVSPGTRTFGFAIWRHGELVDTGMQYFSGSWDEEKLLIIIGKVHELIGQYGVMVASVKIPQITALGDYLTQVIAELEKLLPCSFYTLESLKAYCKAANKEGLMEYCIRKYPEINPFYLKEKRRKKPHYIQVFEAVILGEIASKDKFLGDS